MSAVACRPESTGLLQRLPSMLSQENILLAFAFLQVALHQSQQDLQRSRQSACVASQALENEHALAVGAASVLLSQQDGDLARLYAQMLCPFRPRSIYRKPRDHWWYEWSQETFCQA